MLLAGRAGLPGKVQAAGLPGRPLLTMLLPGRPTMEGACLPKRESGYWDLKNTLPGRLVPSTVGLAYPRGSTFGMAYQGGSTFMGGSRYTFPGRPFQLFSFGQAFGRSTPNFAPPW